MCDKTDKDPGVKMDKFSHSFTIQELLNTNFVLGISWQVLGVQRWECCLGGA